MQHNACTQYDHVQWLVQQQIDPHATIVQWIYLKVHYFLNVRGLWWNLSVKIYKSVACDIFSTLIYSILMCHRKRSKINLTNHISFLEFHIPPTTHQQNFLPASRHKLSVCGSFTSRCKLIFIASKLHRKINGQTQLIRFFIYGCSRWRLSSIIFFGGKFLQSSRHLCWI